MVEVMVPMLTVIEPLVFAIRDAHQPAGVSLRHVVQMRHDVPNVE